MVIPYTIVVLINLLISWLNARTCGLGWRDMSQSGLWGRVVLWSALVQSAIGFTLAYYLVVVISAITIGKAPPAITHYTNDILIIGITIPALGSGLVLTVNSWREFLQKKSIINGGVAAWNTAAQVRNTVELGGDFFSAISDLLSPKSKDDQQGKLLLLAFVLVVVSALLGALTTYWLFNYYRRRDAARRAGLV